MSQQSISRRLFLSLPLILAVPIRDQFSEAGEHRFEYDHVIGTSLDLAVWTTAPTAAERVRIAIMNEVERLAAILNTRDPESEISRYSDSPAFASNDLLIVLALYRYWERRTAGVLSIRPNGPSSSRNVDALGKAYILDCAARAGRNAAPVERAVLNIGGDIVVWGKSLEIAVANPSDPYDNARPFTRVAVQDCAVATSGSYARGAHLLDARSGNPAPTDRAATVLAPDAVTANAIASALCIAGEQVGFSLLDRMPGTAALYIDGARERRTTEFHWIERPLPQPVSFATNWPAGFQLGLSLTLTAGASGGSPGRGGGFGGRRGGRGGGQRPYVAVWIENPAGKLVRVLAFWASKDRYFSELSRFWTATGHDSNLLYSVARATRSPGKYDLVWDGLDNNRQPVPMGTYRVIVETNQEHGSYAKQESTINCGDAPATITLSATTNFEAISVQYGSKPNQA